MNMDLSCKAIFLDSGGGWSHGRESSFILFGNEAFSMYSKSGRVIINLPGREMESRRDPLHLLEGYLSEGYYAVGYLGYEFSRLTEAGFAPVRKKDGRAFPDLFFLFFRKEGIIEGGIKDLKRLLKIPFKKLLNSAVETRHGVSLQSLLPEERGEESSFRLLSNMTKDEYLSMVLRAKEYIGSGDVYQVNLSQRFTIPLPSSPIESLLNLYEVQPVPFACYMDFGEFQIISGSMELFLRKTDRKLVTKPIKGTKKRGITPEADAILRAELVSSEKERAENLMIVDLMRNDLGRVCKYGTVKVNKLFDVESYSTLHHLVSEIEGTLREEVGISDTIRATFPPGSVTGAPKKRSLEIIDELEPHLRGPYCGALGIFTPEGDFTLSVAIRILVSKDGIGTFWAGGGIVWDSISENEYEETLVKARAVKKALGLVE